MPRKKNQKNSPLTLKSKSPKTSEALSVATPKPKHPNFPATGPRKKQVKILPSHRLIYENYKEQKFRNLGKAIRKTGVYSESVASRVDNVTKTDSWQALMDEQLPDNTLLLRHSELLDKRDTKTVERTDEKGNTVFNENGDPIMDEVDIGPNTQAVVKGLEMAYRLKGSYQKEEVAPPSTVMYNLFYKPEVREQMRVFEDALKQTLINEVARKNQKEQEQRIREAEVED